MKFVFSVVGVSDTGKTSTVRLAYKILKQRNPFAEIEEETADTLGELRAILIIAGVRIGFESFGDPCSRIFKSIPYFVAKNCQLIVCATRTRGDTRKLIQNLGSEWTESKFPKIRLGSQQEEKLSNETTALKIVESIEERLLAASVRRNAG